MFLSVRLNFRRPIYPGFYSFAKIFQTLSRDSPALGPTKSVGTKVVPIVHTTRNVPGLAFASLTISAKPVGVGAACQEVPPVTSATLPEKVLAFIELVLGWFCVVLLIRIV
jgi:hypothetical protein